MIKRLLLVASTDKRLEKLVSTSRLTRGLVSRFVAGTTLADAIAVTRELQAQNIDVSLDLLGETVDDLAESAIATKAYIEAVRAIAENRLGATVSVKLSQLGIAVDPAVCAGHLDDLLQAATEVGVGVEIDMEHSSVGPAELEAFRAALGEHPGTRVAMQAAMRRTPNDLESFTDVKPRIRLVKGAFLETRREGAAGAEGDHRPVPLPRPTGHWRTCRTRRSARTTTRCIDHVKASAERLGIGRRDFEFQMLYGVRRDVQRRLADEGYRIRIYLPYGTQWYPYLMRRMAERPANLLLFLRSLISG